MRMLFVLYNDDADPSALRILLRVTWSKMPHLLFPDSLSDDASE